MDLMAAAAFVAEKADLLDQKPRDPRAKFMDPAWLEIKKMLTYRS